MCFVTLVVMNEKSSSRSQYETILLVKAKRGPNCTVSLGTKTSNRIITCKLNPLYGITWIFMQFTSFPVDLCSDIKGARNNWNIGFCSDYSIRDPPGRTGSTRLL